MLKKRRREFSQAFRKPYPKIPFIRLNGFLFIGLLYLNELTRSYRTSHLIMKLIRLIKGHRTKKKENQEKL